uniref:Neuronal regeneration-related protein n=1 Tax=Meleagris gallopavo TaxID=9103 RepID=G3UR20_MELGA
TKYYRKVSYWYMLCIRHKGCLPISKEVNRKKESEVEGACWAPVNGGGHHFTKINYLYTF